MSIELAPELETVVRDCIATGEYSSEHDVLREALGLLKSRQALLAAINEGDTDFSEGRFREFDLESLRAYRHELLGRISPSHKAEPKP